jgi:putative phosphoesterase
MILGIISDTHDQEERTAHAIRMLHQAKAEAIVHCGDLTGANILALFTGVPFSFVLGNNDYEGELKPAAQTMDNVFYLGQAGIIELGGKRIGVAHGHLRKEVHDLFTKAPDYLLTGHSHIAMDERDGKIRKINPGALYRAQHYSVAVLNLQTDELRFLAVPH